jgi:hypothetical protein
LIDEQQLAFAGLDGGQLVVEGHSKDCGRPFGGAMGPGVVNQNAPHHLRRDAKKMRAILPSDALLAQEAQIGFMDKRRRLKGVVLSLATKVRRSSATKFTIDHQLVARL